MMRVHHETGRPFRQTHLGVIGDSIGETCHSRLPPYKPIPARLRRAQPEGSGEVAHRMEARRRGGAGVGAARKTSPGGDGQVSVASQYLRRLSLVW